MILMKLLRLNKELSQTKLAAFADVPPANIQKAETYGIPIQGEKAERLAKVLGWDGDPNDLFEVMEIKADGLRRVRN